MNNFSSGDIVITPTRIKGLFIFEKKLYPDERGWFQEIYRVDDIAKATGIKDLIIKQGSITYNVPGVLRGLHAEPQYKLVTTLTGKVFSAIVDIREDSETFGAVETFSFDYTDINTPRKTLIISSGLANSIEVIGNEIVFYQYAVSSTYDPTQIKRSIRWDDPDLNIDWPIKDPILSEKDKHNPSMRELFPDKFK